MRTHNETEAKLPSTPMGYNGIHERAKYRPNRIRSQTEEQTDVEGKGDGNCIEQQYICVTCMSICRLNGIAKRMEALMCKKVKNGYLNRLSASEIACCWLNIMLVS